MDKGTKSALALVSNEMRGDGDAVPYRFLLVFTVARYYIHEAVRVIYQIGVYNGKMVN